MASSYNQNIFTKGIVTYSDIDLSFKTNPLTNDVRKKTDVEAIKQALRVIIFTKFTEKPFRPSFGAGVDGLLFEPLDGITTIELESSLKTSITNFEPRIEIIELSITENADQNELFVSLKYNMVNVIEPQDLTLILTRTR